MANLFARQMEVEMSTLLFAVLSAVFMAIIFASVVAAFLIGRVRGRQEANLARRLAGHPSPVPSVVGLPRPMDEPVLVFMGMDGPLVRTYIRIQFRRSSSNARTFEADWMSAVLSGDVALMSLEHAEEAGRREWKAGHTYLIDPINLTFRTPSHVEE